MTCFPFPISIVKQTNGNVFIYNNDTGEFVKSLSSDIIKIQCNENGIVKVILDNGSVEYFDPALVVDTQILPASAIPFVGDCTDLSELFATDFFFLTNGSSTLTSDGFDIIVKSANQDVLNSTLTDDLDFQFPVIAGGNYMLTMVLATSSSSSLTDYKFAFAVSAGTINGVGNIVCRNASNSGTVTVISSASGTVTNSVIIGQNTGSIPNVSGIVTAIVDFGFYASADGILKFQFALNSGTAIARTWKGSVLKYKRLD